MPSSTPFRWFTITFALVMAGASCSLVFDYSDQPLPGAGGAGAALPAAGGSAGGGEGGANGCNQAADCNDESGCTDDSCVAGECVHEARADGATCQSGSGQDGICESGTCVVSCTAASASVCDDANECTVDSCDTDIGQCVHDPVDDAHLAEQTPGDCEVVVCSGGVLEIQNDDGDAFDDANSCTDDLCVGGTPSNPPLPEGTSCGSGLVCNATGICVGCNVASDCPGSDSFCQTITCNAGQCGVSYTPVGTLLPSSDQTAGPCKEVQCNGTGGTQNVNESNGTSCDDGLYCNGSDSCLSGNCSQHTGNPCPGSDGDSDCSESCDESANACSANDPNGTSCEDGLYCNGTDSCQSGSCSQHTGDPCPVGDGDADCTEACNESTNSCDAPDPAGASCSDGLYCNGSDSCNGNGACGQHSGDPCMPLGGGCFSSCDESSNNCTAQDAPHTPCFSSGCCDFAGQCGQCL